MNKTIPMLAGVLFLGLLLACPRDTSQAQGNVSLSGNNAFTGNNSFAGTSTFAGNATFNGTITTNALSTFGNTVIFNSNVDFSGLGQTYFTEGNAQSGSAGLDILWADSTAHRLKVNNNNAGTDVIGDTLVQYCGTTSTCSHTNQLNPQVVYGSAALASASPSTVTITGISPAFTSATSYKCALNNETTRTNAVQVSSYASGSSFVITGPNTVTDTVGYVCVGN